MPRVGIAGRLIYNDLDIIREYLHGSHSGLQYNGQSRRKETVAKTKAKTKE